MIPKSTQRRKERTKILSVSIAQEHGFFYIIFLRNIRISTSRVTGTHGGFPYLILNKVAVHRVIFIECRAVGV